MTTDADILQLAFDALRVDGATAAGQRIYRPGTLHTWDRQYPMAVVHRARARKDSLGRGTVQFTAVTTLKLVLRTREPVQDDDDPDPDAEEAAWALYEQVCVALINNPTLMIKLQQIPAVEAAMGVDANGQQLVGEVHVAISFEFYQGPEDFYPIEGVEIDGFDVTVNLQQP